MTATPRPLDSKMSSLSEECNELKHKYDECFNAWFTEKFLKGDKDLAVCDPLMKLYSDCVKNAMKKKNIDLKDVEKEALDLSDKKPSNTNSNSKKNS